jgi:ferrous iron transport protein A
LQLQITDMEKKLSELKVGEAAVITALEDQELVLKLMEMGFLPGEEIVVEQIAPMGDPISVMVAGYQVSLRINEADSVIVATN